MDYKKKLIEVALPLEAINKESAREKSIRHGHPSTLHLWWARRPLAAARAVIWASLVDDPSSLPEQFPTEEAQKKERQRLFAILEKLVKWENINNQDVLAKAKAEIMKSTGGNPPALLDPFAGGGSIPLVNSFVLSKKKGKEAYIQPIIEGNKIRYEVRQGKNAPKPPKMGRGAKFKCVCCKEAATPEHIRAEFIAKRASAQLMAIVAEGDNCRLYISPNDEHIKTADCDEPEWKPEAEMNTKCTDLISGRGYGFTHWHELFINRQLTALITFSDLVAEAQDQAEADAVAAGLINDHIPLSEGGTRAMAYGQAVGVYLEFLVDKLADLCNSLNRWEPNAQCPRQLFARQAIPMVWDFAEGNPFSTSSGSWSVLLRNLMGCFNSDSFAFIRDRYGFARQFDAQSDNGMRNIIVSTDPPYYDNIGYADLSDFFYIWMRHCLKDTYPKLFRTLMVPKAEELVATPYRIAGSVEKARDFFEDGMLKAFRQVYIYAREDIPVTIYYAFKQSESDEDEANGTQTASTGWETMLTAIIQAGFCITGTWPMRTECVSRFVSQGNNALASSIVLVCRKRPTDALVCTRRDFINALKRELKPALAKLQASNIAPVDLAQSSIGPGMGVYSRFSKVLEADGTPMSVRSALQIINQELDLYFTEQDGELDRDSRFCVDLYTQYAFNDVKFGEADVLARAKNTSVEKLAARGILYAQKGLVRLLTREEIPAKVELGEGIIWLLTQQLTRALEKDGVVGAAKIVADTFTFEPEHAKALAYRLFTIAERKGWAAEAYAYNSLVIAWPEVQSKAAGLPAQMINTKQVTFLDMEN